MLLMPYKGNSRTRAQWSVGQFQVNGKYDNGTKLYSLRRSGEVFKLNYWFHTHPGRRGATSMGTGRPSRDDLDITEKFFVVPGKIYGRYNDALINVDGTYKVY